jgi:hemoglobin/transferrin/lactoferrin receptor protein
MKNLLIIALSAISTITIAQKKDTIETQEVLIAGAKIETKKQNIVQHISTMSAAAIKAAHSANTAELIQRSGEVFVQKSQTGGGSPIIRGFESSRVLLMLDGVRMNNAIYRAGHLQNIITVDQNALERVEVVHGPSSALYGSDALGGTIVMQTLQPKLASNKLGFNGSGNAFIKLNTALQEKTMHTDFNLGFKKWAMLTSISSSLYGVLTIGQQQAARYGTWGSNTAYVIPGKYVLDTLMQNANSSKVYEAGYSQLNFMQKILYQGSEHTSHTLNLQHSNSSNINRLDRLSESTYAGGPKTFAQWYYGPQLRNMISYNFKHNDAGKYLNKINAIIARQHIEESRHDRKFLNQNMNHRTEKINVTSVDINGSILIHLNIT